MDVTSQLASLCESTRIFARWWHGPREGWREHTTDRSMEERRYARRCDPRRTSCPSIWMVGYRTQVSEFLRCERKGKVDTNPREGTASIARIKDVGKTVRSSALLKAHTETSRTFLTCSIFQDLNWIVLHVDVHVTCVVAPTN
eukprot:scaffold24_cov341-Pavlova_lutheri.AAC.57